VDRGADQRPRRVVVVGSTGSGKTTLAKTLAARLGYPYVELDSLHWDANWTPAPRELFRERVAAALDTDTWVVDGNYSMARDLVWERADALIWLDYSLRVIVPRLILRSLKRGIVRRELWNGNRERITELFSRNSLVVWALQTHAQRRREYPRVLAQPQFAQLQVIRQTSPGETARWLRAFVESG
jgi:adenylate kinase family enzyme